MLARAKHGHLQSGLEEESEEEVPYKEDRAIISPIPPQSFLHNYYSTKVSESARRKPENSLVWICLRRRGRLAWPIQGLDRSTSTLHVREAGGSDPT